MQRTIQIFKSYPFKTANKLLICGGVNFERGNTFREKQNRCRRGSEWVNKKQNLTSNKLMKSAKFSESYYFSELDQR